MNRIKKTERVRLVAMAREYIKMKALYYKTEFVFGEAARIMSRRQEGSDPTKAHSKCQLIFDFLQIVN